VLEPCCEESGIELRWDVPEDLPPVQGNRHSLLQVLLNLTKNSQRALEPVAEKNISISVSIEKDGVAIRVSDNGPGITAGQKLFQPLQKGAEATGLGLYLSRAFMRSFRGDLRHDPAHAGCSFVIELASAADAVEEKRPVTAHADTHPHEPHPIAIT
jgi:two-component system sensor kinase FixL